MAEYASVSKNAVQRWFGFSFPKAVRCGSFSNVKEPVSKSELFLRNYNAKANPFTWTATAPSMPKKSNGFALASPERNTGGNWQL